MPFRILTATGLVAAIILLVIRFIQNWNGRGPTRPVKWNSPRRLLAVRQNLSSDAICAKAVHDSSISPNSNFVRVADKTLSSGDASGMQVKASMFVEGTAGRGVLAIAAPVELLDSLCAEGAAAGLAEWSFNSRTVGVHSEWLQSYLSVCSDLVGLVEQCKTTHSITHLTIVGHSVGGALATLLAADSAAASVFKHLVLNVVTFGSPRVGDERFATAYRLLPIWSSTSRVVTAETGACRSQLEDEVTRLPHAPFAHASPAVVVDAGCCDDNHPSSEGANHPVKRLHGVDVYITSTVRQSGYSPAQSPSRRSLSTQE